jgi:hypothetical protein
MSSARLFLFHHDRQVILMGGMSKTHVNLFVKELGVAIDFKSQHFAFTFAKLARQLCQSAMQPFRALNVHKRE